MVLKRNDSLNLTYLLVLFNNSIRVAHGHSDGYAGISSLSRLLSRDNGAHVIEFFFNLGDLARACRDNKFVKVFRGPLTGICQLQFELFVKCVRIL